MYNFAQIKNNNFYISLITVLYKDYGFDKSSFKITFEYILYTAKKI